MKAAGSLNMVGRCLGGCGSPGKRRHDAQPMQGGEGPSYGCMQERGYNRGQSLCILLPTCITTPP
ncbi:hypothetical protein GBA52_006697 [Prunus armeniaca]|nr:hypothetical protein GBA52_006697 [Prunus armeniaca]